MKRLAAGLLAFGGLAFLSSSAAADSAGDTPLLWQEQYFFDALLQARDRSARGQSDPQMIPVLKSIAGQAAQQVANLRQIGAYVKAQKENLEYAFEQEDPAPSLETIAANFETLAGGGDQIRGNLYYLTARCRLASTQALQDKEMYDASLLILGQVQQLQLDLNAVYLDTVAARKLAEENKWGTDKAFRFQMDRLMRSVTAIQDAVYAVYNAGYELTLRSR